jgi:hypothetical protein
MKKLYKYVGNFGRMGSLKGLFVADEEEIKNAIGKSIYYGEVLGKHSEIVDDLDKNSFTIVTDDQDFIEKFERFDCESGTNPLEYLDEDEDEDEDEEE